MTKHGGSVLEGKPWLTPGYAWSMSINVRIVHIVHRISAPAGEAGGQHAAAAVQRVQDLPRA